MSDWRGWKNGTGYVCSGKGNSTSYNFYRWASVFVFLSVDVKRRLNMAFLCKGFVRKYAENYLFFGNNYENYYVK